MTLTGAELRVGDTISHAGIAKTITKLEPYEHPLLPDNPARLAYWPAADGHPDTLVVFDDDRWTVLARSGS